MGTVEKLFGEEKQSNLESISNPGMGYVDIFCHFYVNRLVFMLVLYKECHRESTVCILKMQ